MSSAKAMAVRTVFTVGPPLAALGLISLKVAPTKEPSLATKAPRVMEALRLWAEQ
jgi:hypothetical protein